MVLLPGAGRIVDRNARTGRHPGRAACAVSGHRRRGRRVGGCPAVPDAGQPAHQQGEPRAGLYLMRGDHRGVCGGQCLPFPHEYRIGQYLA